VLVTRRRKGKEDMAFRTFRDPEGREWQVWDVVPTRDGDPGARSQRYLPGEMAEGWLCFEAADQKRRLSPLPADWEARDDAGIHALCLDAHPVVGRRPVSSGA
jgi:hypothetical protein